MNKSQKEGLIQCMKCNKYFKEVRCWSSEGYIPKVWYCERCYRQEEGKSQERKEFIEWLDNWTYHCDNCEICDTCRVELEDKIKELKSQDKQ